LDALDLGFVLAIEAIAAGFQHDDVPGVGWRK